MRNKNKKTFLILSLLLLFFCAIFLVYLFFLKDKIFIGDQDIVKDNEESSYDVEVLETFYKDDCTDSDNKDFVYKNPCKITAFDKDNREVTFTCDGKTSTLKLTDPFMVDCMADKTRSVTPGEILSRAVEENDTETLDTLYQYTQHILGIADENKFDLIENLIEKENLIIRLVSTNGGVLNSINYIKFPLEDPSVCQDWLED